MCEIINETGAVENELEYESGKAQCQSKKERKIASTEHKHTHTDSNREWETKCDEQKTTQPKYHTQQMLLSYQYRYRNLEVLQI